MTPEDLTRKVNQIAAFHGAYPRDEAVDAVARHIRDFWDPRMREKLAALVAAGGEGLSPVALAAAKEVVGERARV
ncbi:formate dehydrogenase subunit delta [Tistlia consotensis]|uniref:Formate dehydrogenase subunit delta n=1 Tax=Tistlia consotensis USBA 355 TaxID=560819 RepID=A0A1Y6B6V6_9PROT|nr:formate dehydrogenase subunit delta [Tistlia consotensis]SME88320.1 formate dehydrogenase subunit delta [Tistlia consotensis USBA 355]SNR24786.1 formate dehydrogenase subunit delta [Tistlia consotensis]